MKIEEAIQQQTFANMYAKTAINIMYSASWLNVIEKRLLKPFGITWQQFNILRILRGQKGKPASLKLITERMIDKMSNTSRLVDKLVAKGLVERHVCPEDRRLLEISITTSGLQQLQRASQVMDSGMVKIFEHVPDAELEILNELLDKIRSNEQESN